MQFALGPRHAAALSLVLLAASACSCGNEVPDPADAGVDAGADAGADDEVDAGVDDAGADGGVDGGVDGGFDAGVDGGFDAGVDGGEEPDPDAGCEPETCAERGFACGVMVDSCGNEVDCADEGLACAEDEVCRGTPRACVEVPLFADCEVCSQIPECGEGQETVLRGRVVSPGRHDDDTANQLGIPNALVYLLRSTDASALPDIPTGLPEDGGERCDRCGAQDLGPLLVGAVSDASGYFEIAGSVPVDTPLLIVVKAGKFRRATTITVPASDACTTVELPTTMPDNPTRLPRSLDDDGLALSIPRVAVSTGRIDAMECVFLKMGLSADMFGAPGSDKPVHLFHGANTSDRPAGGAWPDDDAHPSCAACDACGNGDDDSDCRATHCGGGSVEAKSAFLSEHCVARSCRSCAACGAGTTATAQGCRAASCGGTTTDDRRDYLDAACRPYLDTRFLEDASAIGGYDMVVFDCQGTSYDSSGARRASHGERVRRYVNRGGRLFTSHLGHTWLHQNGDEPYSASDPASTGLAGAATWEPTYSSTPSSGTGQITLPAYWEDGVSDWRLEDVSPRIESFATWLESEGVTDASSEHTFPLLDPRSMCLTPGEHTELFVDGVNSMNAIANRVQQLAFSTPYGAPEEATCGRVAYSGFHVMSEGGGSNPFAHVMFPTHCGGDLTDQEKVLLYMLFDLNACVGADLPTFSCEPSACPADACGLMPDGCGGVVDCGACDPVSAE